MYKILLATILMLAAGGAWAQGASPLDAKAAGASVADAATLVKLGDLYLEAYRLDEAKKLYQDALGLQAGYPDADLGLARIVTAQGVLAEGTRQAKAKFEKSKNACRGVARQHKDSAVGEVCAGWHWLSFGRTARAQDEFQKVLSRGDTARGQLGMGEVHRRNADDAQAIAAYNAATAAGAGYLAQLGLGLTQETAGNRQAAVDALAQAVQQEPASCLAHFHYGRLLGQGPQAATALRTAIAIRPGWGDAYHELGKVLLANGDFTGAQAAFQSVIDAEAERGTAFLGLGQALYGQNKPAEARKQLEKAIALVPNLVDAYLLLADIKYAAGETEAALEALEQAKAVAPGVVRVYLHTGQVYFRIGRGTQANSYLRQAITMQPDLSLAHVYLGDIACDRRLYDKGQAHYADALKGDLAGVTKAEIAQRQAVCKPKH